jgi:hypothetical protein
MCFVRGFSRQPSAAQISFAGTYASSAFSVVGQPPVDSVRKGPKARINGCGVPSFLLYKHCKMEYALLSRVSLRRIL